MELDAVGVLALLAELHLSLSQVRAERDELRQANTALIEKAKAQEAELMALRPTAEPEADA